MCIIFHCNRLKEIFMTTKAVFLEACAKLREITHIQVLLAIEKRIAVEVPKL